MVSLSHLLPHSFVLADLFDVQAHSLEIPDFVLEADAEVITVICDDCLGDGFRLAYDGREYACCECKGSGTLEPARGYQHPLCTGG